MAVRTTNLPTTNRGVLALADRRLDAIAISALALFTILSRIPYIPADHMGYDGPLYINALKLDSTYAVPQPGNIGYVLLGKFVSLFVAKPHLSFAIVGIAICALAIPFIYLLSTLLFRRSLAFAIALCCATSVSAWYHSVVIQSYIVWLLALPAIAYFGLRFIRERDTRLLIYAATTLGLSTILRPDLVMFGGPLLAAILLLGRARLHHWLIAGLIGALCCCFWFFFTASIHGGPARYIQLVRNQNEYINTFGLEGRGILEGVIRNTVKYLQFLLWAVHLALIPAAIGGLLILKSLRSQWRTAFLALAWVGPSLYFSIILFMGNAGLILPALPLVYLAAAHACTTLIPRRATAILLALAALNLAQFTLTPLPRMTDQRRVLLTHMFFGYSGQGLRRMYNLQLDDYGVGRSLKDTVHQFMHPDPLPKVPDRLPTDLRP